MGTNLNVSIALCVLALGLGLAAVPSEAETLTYRVVALKGQQAPGTPAGVTFNTLVPLSQWGAPFIDDEGQVAFDATLSGTGVTGSNDSGLWVEDGQVLTLVFREGAQAPGTVAGVVFQQLFYPPSLNGNGILAFRNSLSGPGVTSSDSVGLWVRSSGNVQLYVRAGDSAAGIPPGSTLQRGNLALGPPSINRLGQVAFKSTTNSSNSRGIWLGPTADSQVIMTLGDPAPGIPGGSVFADLDVSSFFPAIVNEAGQTCFFASASNPKLPGIFPSGIWLGGPGSLQAIAIEDQQVPQTAIGTVWSGFSLSQTTINNSGHTAFSGVAKTGPSTFWWGIWEGNASGLRLVANAGQAAPGTGAGVVFGGALPNFSAPVLNATNSVTFGAHLSGTGVTASNDTGIWAEIGGILSLIAREGSQAPGTPSGVFFSNLINPSGLNFFNTEMALNSAGQLAIVATLVGTGVNTSNDTGIWLSDPAGNLTLVAREGDALQLATGDTRTVSALKMDLSRSQGGEDGRGTPLNSRGELTFHASFNGGSQAILVAFPTSASNDVCANAPIVGEGVYLADTSITNGDGAVMSPCGTGDDGHSVWWRYSPLANGTATIDTCGSNFDTNLAVFSDTCPPVTMLACSNDSTECADSNRSWSQISVVAGTHYLIRLSSVNGEPGGDAVLSISLNCLGVHNGDLNQSGSTNAVDIQPFVAAILANSSNSDDVCLADFSENGVVDATDIPGFVSVLVGS